jgi:hypothetical protein
MAKISQEVFSSLFRKEGEGTVADMLIFSAHLMHFRNPPLLAHTNIPTLVFRKR